MILSIQAHTLTYTAMILLLQAHTLTYTAMILSLQAHTLTYTAMILSLQAHTLTYTAMILSLQAHTLTYTALCCMYTSLQNSHFCQPKDSHLVSNSFYIIDLKWKEHMRYIIGTSVKTGLVGCHGERDL